MCEAHFMSTGEILDELVKLTPEERRVIARRLAELESGTVSYTHLTLPTNREV